MEASMLRPRPATFEALLEAMAAAGVRMTLGVPDDGFSMAVEGKALNQGEPEASPTLGAVFDTLEEMTVDLRSVGFPRDAKQGRSTGKTRDKADNDPE